MDNVISWVFVLFFYLILSNKTKNESDVGKQCCDRRLGEIGYGGCFVLFVHLCYAYVCLFSGHVTGPLPPVCFLQARRVKM